MAAEGAGATYVRFHNEKNDIEIKILRLRAGLGIFFIPKCLAGRAKVTCRGRGMRIACGGRSGCYGGAGKGLGAKAGMRARKTARDSHKGESVFSDWSASFLLTKKGGYC